MPIYFTTSSTSSSRGLLVSTSPPVASHFAVCSKNSGAQILWMIALRKAMAMSKNCHESPPITLRIWDHLRNFCFSLIFFLVTPPIFQEYSIGLLWPSVLKVTYLSLGLLSIPNHIHRLLFVCTGLRLWRSSLGAPFCFTS